ncbi:MAG: hypothetical protein ACK5WZ_01415 [Pseudobdellovibrionaceae bacterium]
MRYAFKFVLLLVATVPVLTQAADRVNIWPTIPFVRGADLCLYKDAYGQTRSEYMSKMVQLSSQLMRSGASGQDAFRLLTSFNQMYDLNLALATQNLDVTLESTLKAYISDYYRNLRPRTQKISFNQFNDVLSLLRAASQGQHETSLDPSLLGKLDYMAYGTYALAPSCAGDIQVTIHLIGMNGDVKSYLGQGQPSVVMSQIASKMFEEFQRTQFPSEIKVGKKNLKLIGGMNGSVDRAASVQIAKQACETLDARLPNEFELEILNSYGDWSGGVSLNDQIWALPNGMVFAPLLRDPTPVRQPWEVNATEFFYYCVKD